MGILSKRAPPEETVSKWEKLLHKAGMRSEESLRRAGPWLEKPEKHAALSLVRDHLYDFIDSPERDGEKKSLFGVAKAFPETTRDGYRSYLAEQLQKKAKEREQDNASSSADVTPEATPQGTPEGTLESTPEVEWAHHGEHHHHHHMEHEAKETVKHLFNRKDYSLIYRLRAVFHAEFAEFLGVFTMLAIGLAASAQAHVGGEKFATYTTTVLAWGIAGMLGIYIAGGYSGAHLNPVVTLNLWFYRGFPFSRIFSFWVAQLLGAVAASAWIFVLYYPALRQLNPDGWELDLGRTFFVSAHADFPVSTAWFNEVTATALTHIVIFAIGDSHNVAPARGMNALVLGFTTMAMGSAFGYLTPFGMNPVRDLGPRFLLSMVGFPKQMWTERRWFWLVGEIMGPFVGGILGAGAYDVFIFDGPESPINFPNAIKRRAFMVWAYKLFHPLSKRYPFSVDPALAHAFRRTGESNNSGKVQTEGQPAQ